MFVGGATTQTVFANVYCAVAITPWTSDESRRVGDEVVVRVKFGGLVEEVDMMRCCLVLCDEEGGR